MSSSQHPRTPPESPGRPRQPSSRASPRSANRDRTSTTASEPRSHGRRHRRGPSESESPSQSGSQSGNDPRNVEGQPATGQTLQEFLQSLEQNGRSGRPDRYQQRRSATHMNSDGRISARNSRPSDINVSRRRSSPLMPAESDAGHQQIASLMQGEISPNSDPPPRYQSLDFGNRRLENDTNYPHPGRPVSLDHLESQIYLKPKWQPDSEVSECPICQKPFTFFYRKHHCRKCGRVVCANCSPHRITIPRQYIVEPPAEGCEGEIEETLRAETDENGFDESAIFGGQEVRLCNPCVPDPNPLPPPAYSGTAQNILSTFPPQVFNDQEAQPPTPTRRYPRRQSSQREWISPYATGQSQQEPPRQRSSTDPQGRLGPSSPTGLRQRTMPYGQVDRLPSRIDTLSLHSAAHRTGHRHRSHYSTNSLPSHPGPDRNAPLPPVPVPRPIAEEDECPICHDELPPKGPDGSEDDREAHVSQCIEDHLSPTARTFRSPIASSASATVGAAASSMPSQGPTMPSSSSSSPAAAAAAAGPASSSSAVARTRAETYSGGAVVPRRANMLVYHASEKDCLDADANQKECVICLEDFLVGAELGRLECWCVFHRTCIREWWDTKGLGACPTHQDGI